MAAYAEIAEGKDGHELYLRASFTALDGSDGVRGSTSGQADAAAELGRVLAAELLDRGAATLMAAGGHEPGLAATPSDPNHPQDPRARNRST